MAALDIGKVLDSLHSSKIKDRNGALDLLDIITSSKLRLNAKQFRLITTGIFALIRTERAVFANLTSPAVESRLTRASEALSVLLTRSFDDPHISSKYRVYADIVESISTFYGVNPNLADPCLPDFLVILSKSLAHSIYREHITPPVWASIFAFLVKMIHIVLENAKLDQSSANAEKLCAALFKSLLCLMESSISPSVTPVFLFLATSRSDLMDVLQLTIEVFPRELLVAAMLFRLINKLIVCSSTEDFTFVHKLLSLGIGFVAAVHLLTWEDLQTQFLIFLNLSAMRRFATLIDLPQLEGDDEGPPKYTDLSMCESDIDDSIRSDPPQNSLSSLDLLTNSVRVLLQAFLSRYRTSAFHVTPSDIAIYHSQDDAQAWFKMRSIYLRSNEPKGWLWARGIAQMLRQYFKLKEMTSSAYPQCPVHAHSHQLMLSSSAAFPYKRRKYDPISENLQRSMTVEEFCAGLISHKVENSIVQLGLLLISFFWEMESPPPLKSDSSNLDFSGSSFGTREVIAPTETQDSNDTVLLLLEFTTPLEASPAQNDYSVILKYIVNSFDASDSNYWALLALNAYFARENTPTSPALIPLYQRIMKLALQSINKPSLCALACNIVSMIDRRKLIGPKQSDNTIISQMESIADLAEINGPGIICNESFYLWFVLVSSLKNFGLAKTSTVGDKIYKWFSSKWNDSDLSAPHFFTTVSDLPYFLAWLNGLEINFERSQVSPGLYKGAVNEYSVWQERFQDLEAFISLDFSHGQHRSGTTEECPVPINSSSLSLQCTVILSCNVEMPDGSPFEPSSVLQRSVLLLRLATLLQVEQATSPVADGLRNKALESLQSLHNAHATGIHLTELLVVAKSHNFDDLDTCCKQILLANFPFDACLNSDSASSATRFMPDDLDRVGGVMEREFGARRLESPECNAQSSQPATLITIQYATMPVMEYVKFILGSIFKASGKNPMHRLLHYMEKLKAVDLIVAFAAIIESLDKGFLTLDCIPENELQRLVRLMGEQLLSNPRYERNELLNVVVSGALRVLLPALSDATLAAFRQDYSDVCNWLIRCAQSNLILTLASVFSFCQFLMTVIWRKCDILPHSVAWDLLLVQLKSLPNVAKIALVPQWVFIMSSRSSEEQEERFSSLLMQFDNPEQSVETIATYGLFLDLLTQGCQQMILTNVFRLLKYSRYVFFTKYLKRILLDITLNRGLGTARQLFKSLRLGLLRLWWAYDNFNKFPSLVFGYRNHELFYADNYRELIAIAVSTKSEEVVRAQRLVDIVVKTKQTDEVSIMIESMPLMIPLLYSDDGIRDEVFNFLSISLGNSYQRELETKILLIILETVLLTDVSSEQLICEYFKEMGPLSFDFFDGGSAVAIAPVMPLVKPRVSIDLINRLLEQHGGSDEKWSEARVYFLLRRVTKQLAHSSTTQDQLICLRRIELIVSLGLLAKVPLSITRLLICALAPLMGHEAISSDIAKILSALNLRELVSIRSPDTFPLVIIVVNSLLEHDGLPAAHVVANHLKFLADLPASDPLMEIIIAAICITHRKPCRLSTRSIEATLANADELKLCVGSHGGGHFFDLLARLFPYIRTVADEGPRDVVAQNLLKAASKYVWPSTTGFSNWCAQYLAYFYLEGTSINACANAFVVDEFGDITKDAFSGYTTSMNDCLGIIVDCLNDDDIDAAACAETILGVLIYKFKTLRRHVQRYLDLTDILAIHTSYIVGLDFHSCILLNDETDMDILGDDMARIVDNFCSLIATQPYEVWTTNLILAFMQRAAVYTTIAPLFASFFVKFTHFSARALPGFVCFFISLDQQRGLDLVCLLISAFVALRTRDKPTIDLFTRIILLMRIGSKTNSKLFHDVMARIDLRSLCTMISNANFPRTTIMLFEDHFAPKNICDIDPDNQSIVTQAYESIDESDLHYGIPAKTSIDYAFGATHGGGGDVQNDLMLDSAYFDANIADGSKTRGSEIIRSVAKAGMMGISKLISEGEESAANDETTFEWAWKLRCWDLPQPKHKCKEHSVMYGLLKLIHDYPLEASQTCAELLNSVFGALSRISEGNPSGIMVREKSLEWFRTIAAVAAVSNTLLTTDGSSFAKVTAWFESSGVATSETILLARQCAWNLQAKRVDVTVESASAYQVGSAHELSRYNNISRASNDIQRSISLSVLLNKIAELDFATSDLKKAVTNLSKYHTALTLWMKGDQIAPVQILKDLASGGESAIPALPISVPLLIIHATLVQWLSNSRQDLPAHVLRDHVWQAADIPSHSVGVNERSRVFGLLARFCEDQYRSEPLTSEIARLEKSVSERQAEVSELKRHYSHTTVVADEKKSVQRYYARLKAQLASDTVDLDAAKGSQATFCGLLVKFYLNSATVLDSDSEDLDKFCALWLEHAHEDEIIALIFDEVVLLPAYKLIGWCTQLVSRLSGDTCLSQNLLSRIVIQLCLSHPFHSLHQVISLRMNESQMASQILRAKFVAANKLWAELSSQSPTFSSKILEPVEMFCKEASALAEYKVTRSKSLQLDRTPLGQYWLHSLPNIPPPTKLLPVDMQGNYDKAPVLVSCASKVAIASLGISLPKIGTFTLSDGLDHKVLFKHLTDDLRQDLIMEQVFEKVNHIFDRDLGSRSRRLRIRTYKAVPLGPQQGILEFVPNSIALIDVIGPYHEAHDKYQLAEARRVMKEAQMSLKQKRLDAYRQVERNIQPVLRHFFSDSFVSPEAWFESRLVYSYGLASASIVGHVLGLGDRHCNNILLDRETGEPIHIDLGVAFEQGKQLPIPETVPFRLTRDLVDGLGVSGVEGVFRRGCERTLREMRRNKLHLLAILDVLRWDPLYSWTMSPIRKKRLQEQEDGPVRLEPEADGTEAGCAVRTVSLKLDSNELSVEATVRELIQQATSEHNLLMIYFGWCPFY